MMLKKLYISPEFEWLEIDLLDDVLTPSYPDINDDEEDADDSLEGDGGIGEDGGGDDGGDGDAGDDWW